MKAMIVDDSKAMRRLLKSYVSRFAGAVVEAGDGVDALTLLEQDASPDLAFVDWDMPRMNGLELLQKIRSLEKFSSMQVVMVTAHNSMEDLGQALEAGANDFLMKPITEEMVEDKLRMLGLIH